MKTIWKFRLRIADGPQEIGMPEGSIIIACQIQHGAPFLWATVEPTAQIVKRLFVCVGTGHPIPDSLLPLHHIGTVIDGVFVWHFFEMK